MGAVLVISSLSGQIIAKGVLIIFVGVSVRVFAAFVVSFEAKYCWKEKLFIASTWISKGAVQAVLGTVLLNQSRSLNIPEYEEYGLIIQTTTIFSIIICAPIGAITMNSAGPRLLSYDGPKIT